jgi:hypothetical protein
MRRLKQNFLRKMRAPLLETVKDGWQEEVIRGLIPRQFPQEVHQHILAAGN